MPSIFSKIINREIPANIIAEDDRFIAFLDINPLQEGHTLVIPKKEVDYIFDLEDELLTSLHLFAKKVAIGIGKAVPCARVGVAVVGLEVPHAHIHLVPLNGAHDIDFSRPKFKFSPEAFEDTASRIRAAL